MRTQILILLLFTGAQTLFYAQSSADKTVLETELKRFQAMVDCDTVFLQNLLDPDLLYLHSNGHQEDKHQHLSAIAAKTIVYQSMRRASKSKLRRYGKLALVNGQVSVKGLYQGKAFSVELLYTAVYRKQNRRWLLLNWQSTKVDTE